MRNQFYIQSGIKQYTYIKNKGIIAHIKRRKHKYGPKRIFFETLIQSEVEHGMTLMGYGCDQYYLSFGELKDD